MSIAADWAADWAAAQVALSRPGHNSGLREYAELIAASAGDFAVTSFARSAAVALLAATLPALAPSARADRGWMTEAAMRGAFIGKTLDGYYVDGQSWTETYNADGRLDYRDGTRSSLGYWYFREHVFCTPRRPGPGGHRRRPASPRSRPASTATSSIWQP